MRFLVFDDLGLLHTQVDGGEVEMFGPAVGSQSIDQYFADHCANRLQEWKAERRGLILVHANGRFTNNSRRQDLQGVEVLKHIRLTPWLEHLASWHMIVFSFESLHQVLSRRPGNLILTSPGVTMIQLPGPRTLREALRNEYGNPDLSVERVAEIIAPLDRGTFRPYVASDYKPPDSAHQISNWWGIYEMFLAFTGVEYPEYATPDRLPPNVREFVLRLDTKKVAWLEGSRFVAAAPGERLPEFQSEMARLIRAAAGQTIVYVDDEASNGWLALLGNLLNTDPAAPSCTIATPDSAQLRLADKRAEPDAYEKQVGALAQWVNSNEPTLLILDLRLLGSRESSENPNEASGMDLARAVRASNRYVPILLFTASNKAETLLISQSLDIDDYWMKPGLGEHQGLGSREADLIALTRKLSILLEADYSWLQRVGREMTAAGRSPKKLWWETTTNWPGSSARISPRFDVHRPVPGVRNEVLRYVESILYTARIIFRMQNAVNVTSGGNAPGVSHVALQNAVAERLCAGLFNQIGQVVELVHDVSERAADPFGGTRGGGKTGNARMGGYFIKDTQTFVFRRCDWWAFYLFAWRNKFSHPGAVAQFQEVKRIASDLVAWLISPRTTVAPIDMGLATALAAEMAQTPLLDWRERGLEAFPVLRLHSNEPQFITPATGSPVELGNCGNELAADARFRFQLTVRPEFSPLAKESDFLLSGSQAT